MQEPRESYGKVVQVMGPAVDVAFENEKDLPEIYAALKITNPAITTKSGTLS
jgi:F0F1-type ATP synthase beta subunit